MEIFTEISLYITCHTLSTPENLWEPCLIFLLIEYLIFFEIKDRMRVCMCVFEERKIAYSIRNMVLTMHFKLFVFVNSLK